jgi:uncharacterized membrane protein
VQAYQAIVELLRACALVVGGLIVSAGIVRAALVARGPGGRGRAARRMLDHASLGLDYFVAATLLNLAINGTWTAVAVTALTIAVRKLLTFSLGLVGRGGF